MPVNFSRKDIEIQAKNLPNNQIRKNLLEFLNNQKKDKFTVKDIDGISFSIDKQLLVSQESVLHLTFLYQERELQNYKQALKLLDLEIADSNVIDIVKAIQTLVK